MLVREEQKLFGITIFTWERWNEIDIGWFQFYNVQFPFESMKKYNGMDADINMDGKLSIGDRKLGCEEVWSGYVYEIPEFMEELSREVKK